MDGQRALSPHELLQGEPGLGRDLRLVEVPQDDIESLTGKAKRLGEACVQGKGDTLFLNPERLRAGMFAPEAHLDRGELEEGVEPIGALPPYLTLVFELARTLWRKSSTRWSPRRLMGSVKTSSARPEARAWKRKEPCILNNSLGMRNSATPPGLTSPRKKCRMPGQFNHTRMERQCSF
jgi:hypothetical protein